MADLTGVPLPLYMRRVQNNRKLIQAARGRAESWGGYVTIALCAIGLALLIAKGIA